jgi:endonuclease/exonuclease/phosphatase family metal-dependent hydrolase
MLKSNKSKCGVLVMKISVISFNIRCCDDKDGNSINKRAPRLAKITEKYDADIIGFQEYRPDWKKPIEKFYSEKYDIFSKYRNLTEDIEASPILWRKDKFECIETGYFWLSDTPEVESRGWDEVYNCYRMCLYVTLKDKKNGECFTVMNTHFGFGDEGQIKSARLIFEYSKKISKYPTFIVGDFNMKPDSQGYKAMTENLIDTNAVTARDFGTTYHGYHPETVKDEHIDYCFVDEKIKPVSYKIIKDTIGGKYPSDHFGIYLELNI